MVGRTSVSMNKAAFCVYRLALSSLAGRGGGGSWGGASRWLSLFWPVMLVVEEERREICPLRVHDVLLCCFSPFLFDRGGER
jgi:hypothetical protein